MAHTVKATRRVPLSKLKPYPGNPRRGDVQAIAESLRAHGQYRALVVNKDGTVLAGNHTLLALREIDVKDALCHYVDVDRDEAARIVLADNRTTDLATYDESELVALLQSLPGLDGSGYTDTELVKFQARIAPGSSTPPPPPEQFDVVVSCGSQADRAELIERLGGEGYACRVVRSADG